MNRVLLFVVYIILRSNLRSCPAIAGGHVVETNHEVYFHSEEELEVTGLQLQVRYARSFDDFPNHLRC